MVFNKFFGKFAGKQQSTVKFLEEGVVFSPINDRNIEGMILQDLLLDQSAQKTKEEIWVKNRHVDALSCEEKKALQLPGELKGKYVLSFKNKTYQNTFSAKMHIELEDGSRLYQYKRKGLKIQLSEDEVLLLNINTYSLFKLVENHCSLQKNQKDESTNIKFLAALKKLQKKGLAIDLGVFEKFEVEEIEKTKVSAISQKDGSLTLIPSIGDESSLEIKDRLAQIDVEKSNDILRIKNKVLWLGKKCMKGIKEIVSNNKIPANEVAKFLNSPAMFLDNKKVDLSDGFSIRLEGIEKFTHIPFGTSEKSLLSWFGDRSFPEGSLKDIKEEFSSLMEVMQFEKSCKKAFDSGCKEVLFKNKLIILSNPQEIERFFTEAKEILKSELSSNVLTTEEDYSEEITISPLFKDWHDISEKLQEHLNRTDNYIFSDFRNLLKKPFPHQVEAVQWLMTLFNSSIKSSLEAPITGSLLADDMGLGKSFITLCFIQEVKRQLQKSNDKFAPVLLVAPLSLIKNWVGELEESFKKPIFDSIVILQTDEDLKKYLVSGSTNETKIKKLSKGQILDFSAVRYGLKIGTDFSEPLDQKNRLVLTTYQVLRDYQFSLAKARWSAVIFDEGQALKNPNSLQCRGSKALNSQFKLILTGTPIENSFSDIWCLMDICQPGLLGDFKSFREQFITPLVQSSPDLKDDLKEQLGKILREKIGIFMLRRLKKDLLKSLPPKNIHKGLQRKGASSEGSLLFSEFSGMQLDQYDQVISNYIKPDLKKKEEKNSSDTAIVSLMNLKNISMHPSLCLDVIPEVSNKREAVKLLKQSSKMLSAFNIIENIKPKDEKVIVFIINRKMQWLFKSIFEKIYTMNIEIINGETKAVTKNNDGKSRKELIDQFQGKPGFSIIVISPIACGTGLTITKANHVIHFERHWNPAKESQATDRVYRIGQTKEVHIYFPMIHHPSKDSFDVNLENLLTEKENTKDSVTVSEQEIIKSLETTIQ